MGWAREGVCAQEGFLAEVSLDVDLRAQAHISQEGKGAECLEPLAVGTACAKAWKGEYGCSGNRQGLCCGLLGGGEVVDEVEGEAKQQSLLQRI